MKAFRSSLLSLIGVALWAAILPYGAHSQEATTRMSNSNSALYQSATAFSDGRTMQAVELSGIATWRPGTAAEDQGTVTLIASADGSSEMQLVLNKTGKRIETQSATATGVLCQWAGADGVAHNVSANNCRKSALWFLPSFSLQPSLLPDNLKTVDLDSGKVGSGAATYRHLQSQLLPSGLSSKQTQDIARESTVDLGLDLVSLLPAVLTYSVWPDNGAATPIDIEIHYADYRVVNGGKIPFHVQRYVNGALQLDILVTTAQAN